MVTSRVKSQRGGAAVILSVTVKSTHISVKFLNEKEQRGRHGAVGVGLRFSEVVGLLINIYATCSWLYYVFVSFSFFLRILCCELLHDKAISKRK